MLDRSAERFAVLLFAFLACLPSHAQSPMQLAQIQIYATSKALELAVEQCRSEPLHGQALGEAAVRFRGILAEHIEAGRKAGDLLLSSRASSMEREAEKLADRMLQGLARGASAQEKCASIAADVESQLGWNLEFYLRLGYRDRMREWGNIAGYPCELVRARANRAVAEFVSGAIDFSEEASSRRFLLLQEATRLLRMIDACEAGQSKAAEFRVTDVEDFKPAKAALYLIARTLANRGEARAEKLQAAVSTLKAYLQEEASKRTAPERGAF